MVNMVRGTEHTEEFQPQYYWTYQCQRCFIKSGYGYSGDSIGAYNSAPTCCGGEAMCPVRGNMVLRRENVRNGS